MKYQRTYHVPPKTTLIGLLGAALGLEDVELENVYKSVVTNAILISSKGLAHDLWSITKLKTQAKPERAPVLREIMLEPVYWIYYMVLNKENGFTVEEISNAFNDPRYALSLGRSDELIRVLDNDVIELEQASSNLYYKNTILPFNYREFFNGFERMNVTKGQVLNLPQLVSVPVSFTFERGRIRKPSKYETITLVYDVGVRIKQRKDGWIEDERNFFLY